MIRTACGVLACSLLLLLLYLGLFVVSGKLWQWWTGP